MHCECCEKVKTLNRGIRYDPEHGLELCQHCHAVLSLAQADLDGNYSDRQSVYDLILDGCVGLTNQPLEDIQAQARQFGITDMWLQLPEAE